MNDLIEKLENIAKDYSDNGKMESVGAFDEHGNARHEITFDMGGKTYCMSFGEMPEE